MTITEYNKYEDILVEFEDGYTTRNSYRNFRSGRIASPYDKTILGVGFIGEGKYKTQGVDYACWSNMIKRCYKQDYKNKHLAYKDCVVDKYWHNFQNFAKWWEENYYQVGNEKMCLDKDILVKGNKIYSANTCLVVPERINNLFIKQSNTKYNLPIGVTYTYRTGEYGGKKYMGRLSYPHDNKKDKRKTFHTVEEAFMFYKIHKENYIKQIANEYKIKIPRNLYDALMNYIVEIND